MERSREYLLDLIKKGDKSVLVDIVDTIYSKRDDVKKVKITEKVSSVSSVASISHSVFWESILAKPTEFPPSSHFHQISDVVGLSEYLGSFIPKSWIGIAGGVAALGDDGRVPRSQSSDVILSGVVESLLPELTVDGVAGTITVPALKVQAFDNDYFFGNPERYQTVQTVLSLPEGQRQYVSFVLSGGSYSVVLVDDPKTLNMSNRIPIYAVTRIGTTIHSIGFDTMGHGLPQKAEIALLNTTPYRRSTAGGLILSEDGSRRIQLTAADVFAGTTMVSVLAYNSLTDTLTECYHVGGVWNYSSSSTVYDNSSYDNGTGKVALGTNKWKAVWFFRSIGDAKEVFYVNGDTEYNTQEAALAAKVPAIPPVIGWHGMLVGRIILQNGASSGLVQSAFDQSFGATPVFTHNALSGLQGGLSGEYYHITSAQHTTISSLTGWATKAFTNGSTTDVAEGANLYFTTARADARITLQKGVANGIASLGSDGKVPISQLPATTIVDTFVVASQTSMLALTAQQGDVCVRTDLSKTFILKAEPASTLANWQEMLSPSDGVQSVAMTVSGPLAVSGSPITNTGTLGLTWSGSSSNLVRADGSVVASSSFSSSSHTHSSIALYGSAPTSATAPSGFGPVSGMSYSTVANQDYPSTYGNIINVRGSGGTQIFMGWSSSNAGAAGMWIRNHRDTYDGWSPWQTVYTSSEFTVTSFTKTILDDTDASSVRATIGLPWVEFPAPDPQRNHVGIVVPSGIGFIDNVLSIQNKSSGDWYGSISYGNAAINFKDLAGTERAAVGYSRNSAIQPTGYIADTLYCEIGNPFTSDSSATYFRVMATIMAGSPYWGGASKQWAPVEVSSRTGKITLDAGSGGESVNIVNGPLTVGESDDVQPIRVVMTNSVCRIREFSWSNYIGITTNISNLVSPYTLDDSTKSGWILGLGYGSGSDEFDSFQIKRVPVGGGSSTTLLRLSNNGSLTLSSLSGASVRPLVSSINGTIQAQSATAFMSTIGITPQADGRIPFWSSSVLTSTSDFTISSLGLYVYRNILAVSSSTATDDYVRITLGGKNSQWNIGNGYDSYGSGNFTIDNGTNGVVFSAAYGATGAISIGGPNSRATSFTGDVNVATSKTLTAGYITNGYACLTTYSISGGSGYGSGLFMSQRYASDSPYIGLFSSFSSNSNTIGLCDSSFGFGIQLSQTGSSSSTRSFIIKGVTSLGVTGVFNLSGTAAIDAAGGITLPVGSTNDVLLVFGSASATITPPAGVNLRYVNSSGTITTISNGTTLSVTNRAYWLFKESSTLWKMIGSYS